MDDGTSVDMEEPGPAEEEAVVEMEVVPGEKPLPMPECAMCEKRLTANDPVQVWLVCQNCGTRAVEVRCGNRECDNYFNQTCKLRSIIINKHGKCNNATTDSVS